MHAASVPIASRNAPSGASRPLAVLKELVKGLFLRCGFKISRRDRLDEQIPGGYLTSPFLPRVYTHSLGRLFYFRFILDRVRQVPGDIVECGVSTGHGILFFALLSELSATKRSIWGFDSFAGFPASREPDTKSDGSFQVKQKDYASPPEMVLKVLSDGRVSPEYVAESVRLVRGFFHKTVRTFDAKIAVLHLDCDLYDSYIECLRSLYDKVVPGGIIMFDEYEDRDFPGAKRAVDEFFLNKPEKPIEYEEFGYRKHYVIKS